MSRLIRILLRKCSLLGRAIYGILLKASLSKCGIRFLPSCPLTIKGGKNIRIGNNFHPMKHCYLYADEGEMVIGDNFVANTNVVIGASSGKIVIGNNVLIGPNVVLRASDHGIAKETLINRQPHIGGLIAVEDDVWIGSNAVILKDVRLGHGCVVAAGAVVTRDVEPYSIVGGVPAKKISERV